MKYREPRVTIVSFLLFASPGAQPARTRAAVAAVGALDGACDGACCEDAKLDLRPPFPDSEAITEVPGPSACSLLADKRRSSNGSFFTPPEEAPPLSCQAGPQVSAAQAEIGGYRASLAVTERLSEGRR